MAIIAFAFIGFLVGSVFRLIFGKSSMSLILCIVLGTFGGVIGGWIYEFNGVGSYGEINGSLIASIAGAFTVLFLAYIISALMISTTEGVRYETIPKKNTISKSLTKANSKSLNKPRIKDDSSPGFISKNINKAKKFTEKVISKSYLTGCTWRLIDESSNIQYIFRDSGELLIVNQGRIQRSTFELIVDKDSIIIDEELYNIVLVKDNFLFLNRILDNSEYRFANETKFKDSLMRDLIFMANQEYGN